MRRRLKWLALVPVVAVLVLGRAAEAAEVTGTIAIGGDALTVSMPAVGDTARIEPYGHTTPI